MIPASANPLLLRSAATQYQVSRSLRFNSADSAYLSRTPASAGNRTTWTFSCWLKRSKLGAQQSIFIAGETYAGGSGDTWATGAMFGADDKLNIYWRSSNSPLATTAAVYRDCSAWYHIVLTANSTTLKAYVNGSEVASGSISGNGAVNSTLIHLIGVAGTTTYFAYANQMLAECHFIDGQALDPSSFTEVSATTGQLIPKAYTGSYGTNGFKLTFSDNSNNTATTLGKDTSGNNNNWTPTNLQVSNENGSYLSGLTAAYTNCSQVGSISNMFDGSTSTIGTVSGSNTHSVTYTLATGKAYTSLVRIYAAGAGAGLGQRYVLLNGNRTNNNTTGWVTVATGSGTITSFGCGADNTNDGGIYAIEVDGVVLVNYGLNKAQDSLVDTPTSYGTDTGAGGEVRGNYATLNPLNKQANCTLANGNLDWSTSANTDLIAISTVGMRGGKWYCECTVTAGTANCIGIQNSGAISTTYLGGNANSWVYYQTGSKINNASSSAYGASYAVGDVIGIALDTDNGTLVFYKNGSSQGTAYSGLSTTDTYFYGIGNGGGSFSASFNFGQRAWAYTPPANHRPLVGTLLPSPVVAKPSTVMDVKTYTGNGSTQTISGLGFSPDLVWIKSRSAATDNTVYDAIRGEQSRIETNNTEIQVDNDNGLTAFNNDGFSLGSLAQVNTSSATYVAWCFDAGSSTVTNTTGSISSSVRSNASSGFSIIRWIGTGASGTVGHGLGVQPVFMIIKNIDRNVSNFVVNTSVIDGSWDFLQLNTTAAKSDSAESLPTSSVLNLGAGAATNELNSRHIAYCFAPVAGYSSFGSYTGNGSTDGPFVYTGFRPRWIMVKNASLGTINDYWVLFDAARNGYNVTEQILIPNLSDAEGTSTNNGIDLLSNGFKWRATHTSRNASGSTYVWVAFAESPFQYARAR